MRVIEAADLSIAVPHILHLFSGDLSEVSRSVEIGHSLRPLRNGSAASLTRGLLLDIRGLYIALHGKYDLLCPPASYHLCEDDSHRNLTTHVQ
jgi:hypothetical protein